MALPINCPDTLFNKTLFQLDDYGGSAFSHHFMIRLSLKRHA